MTETEEKIFPSILEIFKHRILFFRRDVLLHKVAEIGEFAMQLLDTPVKGFTCLGEPRPSRAPFLLL